MADCPVTVDLTAENAVDSTETKKKKTSRVWLGFVVNPDGKTASCKKCKKVLTLNKSTTSNLLNHLTTKTHSSWFDNLCGTNPESEVAGNSQEVQTTLEETFAKQYDQGKFEHLLINYVVSQDESFLLIESSEFKNLIAYLNPKAKLFSRVTLQTKIMDLYNKKKTEVKNRLTAITSKISFTTDLWTSPNNLPFMAITAHYIDDTWKMNGELIDFVCLLGKHTGSRIAEQFKSVVRDEYKISNEGAINVDNATSNDKFIKIYSDDVGFSANWHLRCFAHVLNLAVKRAVEILVVNQLVKLRDGIKSVKASPQRLQRLEEICSILKIKYLIPELDVSTRFNSTCIMIGKSLRLKPALRVIFEELQKQPNRDEASVITDAEWEDLEKINEFLHPFTEATEMVSGERYVTISLIVPLYDKLMTHCNSFLVKCPKESELHKAVEACFVKLTEYHNKLSNVYRIATILDPRFNLGYFETSSDPSDIKCSFKEEFEKTYAQRQGQEKEKVADNSLIASLFRTDSNCENEVESYVKERRIARNNDPLSFWAGNETKYPCLAAMAKDFLAAQGTAIASERMFSSGKHTISDTRCSLTSDTIRALQCLKSWLKNKL